MDVTVKNDVPGDPTFPMISFEKQMFLDILEHDALMISAK